MPCAREATKPIASRPVSPRGSASALSSGIGVAQKLAATLKEYTTGCRQRHMVTVAFQEFGADLLFQLLQLGG